ncbi:hypothetical protein PCURB6_27670 [Paenibacillus curdlanolyticus]|nr:hypothetical protein PCURB6_27670 [Paenibacillus curdlanolyticus]
MISRLSKRIVKWIYDNLDDENRTRFDQGSTSIIELEKGLKITFLYIMIIISIVISSYWIEKTDLIFSSICLVFIRLLNGGHHFKPDLCYLVTTSVIIGTPIISPYMDKFWLFAFLWTLFISLLFTPFNKHTKKNDYLRKIFIVFLILVAYSLELKILITSLFILSFDWIKYEGGRGKWRKG